MPKLAMLSTIVVAAAFISGLGGGSSIGNAAERLSGAHPASSYAARLNNVARGEDAVLIAVGDISDCRSRGDEATATLIRRMTGTVATLGDHVYRDGSRQEFADCYDPTWGAEKGRTRPAAGNHDYGTRGARGYFDYFGAAAGDRRSGFYSYDLGAWHIIVLNSNCKEVGGCEADSPQGRWLRADLAANPATCTLAYWHHPLFSSGKKHGGDDAMRPVWEALYEAGVDVVLNAHEHNYERFARQDPHGSPDSQRGIRAFVVGSGGAGHYEFSEPLPLSEKRNADTYGVLKMTLRSQGYDWQFVPVGSQPETLDGRASTDSGSAACH